MSTQHHTLHPFDLRSLVLFASLTLGCSAALFAQTDSPSPPPAAAQPSAPTTNASALAPEEVFKRADINRDQQLSRDEAQNLPSVAEQFDEWDRDGNGSLSLQEFLLGANKGQPN